MKMRKYFVALLAAAFVAGPVSIGFAASSAKPTIVMAGKQHWMPGTGMIKGSQITVVYGDPSKPGLYVIQLKIPANTTYPAHYHGEDENVTVLSGMLWVGLGDKIEPQKMVALGAGSFGSIPANVHHYAMTKVPTIIEITSVGPRTMIAAKKP